MAHFTFQNYICHVTLIIYRVPLFNKKKIHIVFPSYNLHYVSYPTFLSYSTVYLKFYCISSHILYIAFISHTIHFVSSLIPTFRLSYLHLLFPFQSLLKWYTIPKHRASLTQHSIFYCFAE